MADFVPFRRQQALDANSVYSKRFAEVENYERQVNAFFKKCQKWYEGTRKEYDLLRLENNNLRRQLYLLNCLQGLTASPEEDVGRLITFDD